MIHVLYLHEVANSSLPDRYFAPGRTGLRAGISTPAGAADLGIKGAPETARWLLVVIFSVPQRATPPAWQLEYERLDDEKRHYKALVHIMEPPLPSEARERVSKSSPPAPEQLYDGAYWVDLTSFLASGLPAPGTSLTLRYGDSSAVVSIPAAAAN
jgi:hypothetical protein